MKNEKFCFSKGTGLIALVGIFLIVAVFAMNTVTSEKQTTGAKASFGCPSYSIPQSTCSKDLSVMDYNGVVTTVKLGKATRTCCYPAALWNPKCPSGSTVDYLANCPLNKQVYGAFAKNTITGNTHKCCNWIDVFPGNNGPQGGATAVPAATVVPATVVPTAPTNSTLIQSNEYCTNLKLFDVPKDFATYYYNYYCKVNEQNPHWDGLRCTAAVGVCGNNRGCLNDMCISVQNQSLRCLNVEVPFDWCLRAGVAHDYDAPRYVGDGKCENRTCAGNIHINECAPQSTKRCICKQGMSYPTYIEDTRTDTTKCKVVATVNCMYAEQIVTTLTTPYNYVESSVDSTKKCIQKDGKNIGYRCKTNTSGTINATGSLKDKVNCPL